MAAIIPGMRYETVNDSGDVVFYRITSTVNEPEEYKAILEGDNTFTKHKLSKDFLLNNCVKITPDAFINIMYCNIDDEANQDIFICVNKSTDIGLDNNIPSLVLRQNIYSYTKNALPENATGNDIWVGDCFTTYSTEDMKEILDFTNIIEQYSIAFYIGDSQQLINRFIDSSTKKDFNKALLKIEEILKSYSKYNVMYKGFSESISDLMDDNNFIVGLYGIFNIMYIDFDIDLKTNHNDEDDIILTNKQITRLQNYMGKFISDPIVLKYDRDINIANIISKQHIMVVDPTSTVYLIAFDIIGYYENNNDDVLEAMGQNV